MIVEPIICKAYEGTDKLESNASISHCASILTALAFSQR
jgi:hypothetical protein